MLMSRVFGVLRANILFGVLIKLRLATLRAEIVGLPFVFTCTCGSFGINCHSTNWVFEHVVFSFY